MTWDKRTTREFAAALGAGTLVRVASGFGVRQLVKLIPVYGQTAGAVAAATASFAATYAMGKAATHFLRRRQAGAHGEDVQSVYRAALKRALRLASEGEIGTARREASSERAQTRPAHSAPRAAGRGAGAAGAEPHSRSAACGCGSAATSSTGRWRPASWWSASTICSGG